MRSLRNTGFTLLLLVWSSAAAAQSVCYRAAEADECLGKTDPRAACEASVNTDPYDLSARFSLCEVYLKDDQPLQAWMVLDQGLKLCGRNRRTCSRLQIALSNLEEESEIRSRDDSASERSRRLANQESQRRICLRRMNGDLSLNACNEILLSFPDDVDLNVALAEKLINRGFPARAVRTFQHAIDKGGNGLQASLRQAEQARTTLAAACLAENDLDQCNRALLPGAEDESRLQLRRAELLRAAGNTGAATGALLLAQTLRPDDAGIARQIVAALPQSNLDDGDQAAARGRAHLALGNADAALRDLQRSQRLGIEAQEIAAELDKARSLRAGVVERECLQRKDIDACRKLLIAGEPDAQRIRAHIAALERPVPKPAPVQTKPVPKPLPKPLPKPEPQPEPDLEPESRPQIASLAVPATSVQTVATRQAPAQKQPKRSENTTSVATIAPAAETAAPAIAVVYSNATDAGGFTH